jgi:hypothetical protein
MSAFTEHLRLTLLRFMAGAPEYRASSSILQDEARRFGLAATRDQVKTELNWLAEQGLAKTEDLGALTVAELTERGLDVAEGRAHQHGVQRPAPRA